MLKHLMLKHLMLKKRILSLLIYGVFLSAGAFFTTCGLEEYYYLPQVPEGNILTEFNTFATINLPSISSYYYAQNYIIFYRIYISDYNASSISESIYSNISPSLASDYNVIWPNTDPTSTTAGTPAKTLFTSRNYFELELYQQDINNILSKNGGNITISFPTTPGDYPVLSLNNSAGYRLYRAKNLLSPEPDKFFRNSTQLSDPSKATTNINADVAGRTGLSQSYAYVSLYIVAMGANPSLFTPIYSKPTHISVFRLPES